MKTVITTLSIQLSENDESYLKNAKKLIDTYLNYTNFDILLLTNNPSYFDEKNTRLKIYDYDLIYEEPIKSSNKFNMHLKRLPIKLGMNLGYDIIFFTDCDCFVTGWDSNSFENKVNEDFDVAFPNHANPQLGSLRKTHPHFNQKIQTEFKDLFYDKLNNSPNPNETRVIFKNNQKLKKFLSFWDEISKRNNNYLTYFSGVYFGTSATHADMKMIGITKNDLFTKFCKISHGNNNILDYFGQYSTL